jgi:thiamine-phosphate pyrophosphorylase
VVNKKIYRVLDVNLNRVREGLRVCEDTARFIFKEKSLTRKIRRLRHDIYRIIKELDSELINFINFRNVKDDFGKTPNVLEKKRENIRDIFLANFQRSKEALRSLEEFSKLIDKKISDKFKKIRFRLYSLEKETLEFL